MIPGGSVYFVGAGPGSVDYLTVRGREVLERADAIVCDALADDGLLALAREDCEIVEVGKRGGRPSTPQAQINDLLAGLGRAGKQVVRLKGGDPFVFGRCTGEIEAARAAGCAVEVIPGISSALAAPLLAGIPLTDAVLSRAFAVCSGHDPDALNWASLSAVDTLAILMGTRHLADIVGRLQRHGRSRDTPIAIVKWAGRSQQRVWVGTLEDICDRAAGEALSPSVIVVGEVVRLREFLAGDGAIAP